MNASPAVTPSGDGVTGSDATQGYGPRPAEHWADAPTIEFAPGLRRPISLGTPPPPPTDMFETRLGRLERRPVSRTFRVLVPVVAAGMVFAAVGVGMTLQGGIPAPGPSSGPVARTTAVGTAGTAAATPGASASESTAADTPTPAPDRTAAVPQGLQPPPPPDQTESTQPPGPKLTGNGAFPFGHDVLLNASGFPCGAGARVNVTIGQPGGVEHLVFDGASSTQGDGSAAIHIFVDLMSGQVATGPPPHTYVTLSQGAWTVKASTTDGVGCAASSATMTVTITAA